jgi:hypothetical protein
LLAERIGLASICWTEVELHEAPAISEATENQPLQDMESDESPNIRKLRANFENREAIYIEKGALRVRVTNIQGSALHQVVSANVEEVLSPKLGVGWFGNRERTGTTPRRWRIEAGFLTSFSSHGWMMGYGGWSLYFDPKTVQGVLNLASQLPDDMDTFERYNKIVIYAQRDASVRPASWESVFENS